MPLRLHPMSRSAINNIILRYKDAYLQSEEQLIESTEEQDLEEKESLFYFGVILLSHTVVTIFKSNSDISVTP
jgi:hypothetical protein